MLRVEVVHSPEADRVDHVSLTLEEGATVEAALRAAGLLERASCGVGVWGELVALDRLLADGDRVEVYRPLAVDPKEARRLRQRAQGRAPRKR